VKKEPCHEQYHLNWVKQYETMNYDTSLAGKVLKHSHALLEKPFNSRFSFSKVLEVGAGSGVHIDFVNHQFDEYWMTDSSTGMLKISSERSAQSSKIRIAKENASNLSFVDNSFDRLIASHVLEHLSEPHEVLREWARVVKPGGVISLILPCDPGFLWRFGRRLGPRRRAIANGIDYDYWMAREHINPIQNLVTFIEYYFDNTSSSWWPIRLPSFDLNLIYVVNIHV
jgi:phosphatidylethanolamine/phosphatidyl-N-methylethanolamine N-methyltransferase